MVREEEDGVWVTLNETIAAHHDDVFDLLTTADGLTRWFPVAARIDLRPGGLITFGWDSKFTRRSTIAILEYDPGGRVVWDWYMQSTEVHAPVAWTVEPSREEGAKVRMRQGPFAADTASLIAMAEEAESWRWYLCNMRGVMEVGHDMRRVRPL